MGGAIVDLAKILCVLLHEVGTNKWKSSIVLLALEKYM